MQVHKIPGVCSMLSISENPSSELSKVGFLNKLNKAIDEYNSEPENRQDYKQIRKSDIKCVMLVANRKFYLWSILKHGFSYKGNDGKATVKFIKFDKGLKYELIKQGVI